MGNTYAMMLSTTEDLFQEEIWTSLSDYVEEGDDKIFFFCGKPLYSTVDDEMYSNVVFNLMKLMPMQGLITLTGTLNSYIGTEAFKKYLNQFGDIPKVSISVPLEGCSNVLLDNFCSSFTLCNHLIEHGYKRFGILTGPAANQEAHDRLLGTQAVLEKNGIDDVIIIAGDFSKPSGYRGALELIDAHVDVIICANDLMALGAYEAIEEKGLRIPTDIAVVGFDDIEQSRLLNAPLTTIRQPFENMVRSAYDILKGREQKDLLHMGELVVRESCGCEIKHIDAKKELDGKKHYMRKYDESIQQYTQTIHMHTLFDQVNSISKLTHAIDSYLETSNASEFHLCLFKDHKKLITDPLHFEYPEKMVYQYGYSNGKRFGKELFNISNGLPKERFEQSRSNAFLIYPINHHDSSFGYLVVDSKTARNKTFTALRREINNALSRIDMYLQIKQYSQQMAKLATMDTMTGMLNRRGFFSYVNVDFPAQIKKQKSPGIIFCDVNGLKKVNDNHGHAYGDRMIVHTSNILKKVFKNDTIARLGGDEFIVYRSHCDHNTHEDIYKHIEHEIEKFNKMSKEPFILSLEAGMSRFDPTIHSSLDELISHADKKLYQKKHRCRTPE